MALTLSVSNSLDSLADALCARLYDDKQSLFEPYVLVTQTQGINNWLKLKIAEQKGIAANLQFFTPNELIQKIYYLLGGPYPDALHTENLRWLIYQLLGEEEFVTTFGTIAAYYQNNSDDQEPHHADQKRIALARKVADLFDQYQIYRPQMIAEWNSNHNLDAHNWQAWLWRKAKDITKHRLPDKTLIGHYIIEALKSQQLQHKLQQKLPAIHLFGLSIFTDYHIGLLEEIARYCQVHFHMLNPAPFVYWQDEKTEKALAKWRAQGWPLVDSFEMGNPLLIGWGNVLNDTFKLFFNRAPFANSYETIAAAAPDTDTLLHVLQNDIFHSATKARNRISEALLTDGSITINACYTPLREVEALYNYLVHLYDNKKEQLALRDIAVMVSDIDAYAPYIHAVFGQAAPKLRYTIADESILSGNNILEALSAILSIHEENFTAENVLQLLDFQVIKKRQGIADAELIRLLVDKANIRFGFSGDEATDTWSVSWEYGLQRILYGVCMSEEALYNTSPHSLYPIDAIEGIAAQQAISWVYFVRQLMSSIKERRKMRTLSQWATYIENITHSLLYLPGDEVEENYTALMHHLASYAKVQEWVSELLPFEVFSQNLKLTLQSYTKSSLYIGGGITFCSLLPMRSIPFKVVALLGMDYDRFPRKDKKLSFNLMLQQRQLGDRNIKDNDKHLFLETLLSARQYLYISYRGMDAKDNSVLPPSALVDELLDYIDEGMDSDDKTARSFLLQVQPLHNFSLKYKTNPKLYNYLNRYLPEKRAMQNEAYFLEPYQAEKIGLSDIVRFLKNPVQSFYNKVYGIYYEEEETELPEEEIFDLDALQQWQLKNTLFAYTPNELEAYKKEGIRKGYLPLANMADVALQPIAEEVMAARALWHKHTAQHPARTAHVLYQVEGTSIEASFENIFDEEQIVPVWSKSLSTQELQGAVQLLVGAAAGAFNKVILIHAAANETVSSQTVKQDEAKALLAKIISRFRTGHSELIPYFYKYPLTNAQLQMLRQGTLQEWVEALISDEYKPEENPYITQAFAVGVFNHEGAAHAYLSFYDELIVPLLKLFDQA